MVFDDFVVGAANRDAYEEALAYSLNDTEAEVSLLLNSDFGLGKTHLLHAVGNNILINNPTCHISCLQ